jgi:hypothetical protein
LEEGAAVTAQRPMFKNWERRLIREELGRAATPHPNPAWEPAKINLERAEANTNQFKENFGNLRPAELAKYELGVQNLKEELSKIPKTRTSSVVRFADADTVAKVEAWPVALSHRLGNAVSAEEFARAYPKMSQQVLEDYQGRLEFLAANEPERVAKIPKKMETARENTAKTQKYGVLFENPEHAGIYLRYQDEVTKYLKSLGGKETKDDKGQGWWEVPVKPSAKRVQLFSMGGGAVTVGGGVAAPGDFGYTVPTEED